MRWRSLDLAIVYAVTMAGMLALIIAGPGSVARQLLALPLVLLNPGYALASAISPNSRLGMAERVVVALGLSLALAALGGIVLHQLPWGLQAGTWVVYLGSIIMGGILVAWLRRGPAARPGRAWAWSTTLPQRLYFALSALVLAGAISLAVAGAQGARGAGPTQMWLVPGGAGASYVQVGLLNMEPQSTDYRISLEIDGQAGYAGEIITLEPQELAMPKLELPDVQGRPQRIEIKLYRMEDQDMVYRRLTYWRFR